MLTSSARFALPALACLALPATAGASVAHTVGPGETMWSIAAASNLTTRSLAASNGLPAGAPVVLGSTIQVPSVSEASTALARRGVVSSAASVGDGDGDADDGVSDDGVATGAGATPAASSTGAPAPMGAYVVRRGDTLSAIAARNGVSARQVAWMNGLSTAQPLLAGTALKLPTGSPNATPVARTASVSATPVRVVAHSAPYATGNRLTSTQIGSIAANQGVPSSLASAVAWQESGFNNGAVSSANARGVMQVLPGTWDYVQRNLTSRSLNPFSAQDNVRAGSLYLGSLLRQTGGNVRQAVAAYYQGLSSVRQIGMYADTQRYVANVMRLRQRFGGP